MTSIKYRNIFSAVTENQKLANDLKIRADLIIIIRDIVKHLGWGQTEVAKILSLTRPRVSDLLNGEIDKLPIELLVSYLYGLGLYLKPID